MNELRLLWFVLKQTIKETFCKHDFSRKIDSDYFCSKCGIAKQRYEAERIFK